MRTCIACRQVKPKQELVRLVNTGSGTVEVDASHKKAGRGVYLCPSPVCWQTGLGPGRLEHALRTTITSENREQLVEYGKGLVGESDSG